MSEVSPPTKWGEGTAGEAGGRGESPDDGFPSAGVWLVVWCVAVGLVLGCIWVQTKDHSDPDVVFLQPGRIEQIHVTTKQELAVYIASNPSSDMGFPYADPFCTAISPELTLTPADRLNFYSVDGTNSWIRLAYIGVSHGGTHEIRCVEHEGRPYAVAWAEPGHGWVKSLTDLVIRGAALVALTIPLMGLGALWARFRRARRARKEEEAAGAPLIR